MRERNRRKFYRSTTRRRQFNPFEATDFDLPEEERDLEEWMIATPKDA